MKEGLLKVDRQADFAGLRASAAESRAPWLRHGVRAGMAAASIACLGWWGATASASDPAPDTSRFYVSIGDSYAAGYRPSADGSGTTSRDGFVYRVEERMRAADSQVQLANFGCSGTTAYGMAFDIGCADEARAPGGQPYTDTPQAVAAVDFISQHSDRIGLVTIAIGANDLLRCVDEPDPKSVQGCAEYEVPRVRSTLDWMLERIRAAVGDDVPVVGISYINVFLAEGLEPDAAGAARADTATVVFQNYLNPVLSQTYMKYGAKFVDTTALAGAYLPQTDKTWLPGHGTVPASIGRVCSLTYYCGDKDPHPNRAGHDMIAREVEKAAGL